MVGYTVQYYSNVPCPSGPRPLWLSALSSITDWRQLVVDPDWKLLVEEQRAPFGLFTASGNPRADIDAWVEFADHCVQFELLLVSSWGQNSTVLDDVFDMSAVMRAIDHLPTADPMTSWHDDEPLHEAFEFFIEQPGSDLREPDFPSTAWTPIALAIGEGPWQQDLLTVINSWGQ